MIFTIVIIFETQCIQVESFIPTNNDVRLHKIVISVMSATNKLRIYYDVIKKSSNRHRVTKRGQIGIKGPRQTIIKT